MREVVVGSPATRRARVIREATVPDRRRKEEETHEELIARIERELLNSKARARKLELPQMCTKCGIVPVESSYMVDRDTGYCAACAEILGLGHTREARNQNFHPTLVKSEDED